MANKRNNALLVVSAFCVSAAALYPGSASALTMGGAEVVMVDGDTDANLTVRLLSSGNTAPYTYGYFLNSGLSFQALSSVDARYFNNGDIIDFALYDGTRYYTLSGDEASADYSVTMSFNNPVTIGAPQLPGDSGAYYYNLNIVWNLPFSTVVSTNEYALNFINYGNDGIAPVPEPSMILLLGSGILGAGLWLKRKRA